MNINHIAKKPFFDLFYRSPCMPTMLRLALTDAASFNVDGSLQGPTGTIDHRAFKKSHELEEALRHIVDIKHEGNHITQMLSISDLIQMGGYAAIEYCEGPSMLFRMGRFYELDSEVAKKVQGEEGNAAHSNSHLVASLTKLHSDEHLTAEEFIALHGGLHSLGFMGASKSGPSSRWTQNPYVFNNDYFKELLLGDRSKYYKHETDFRLVQNPAFKGHIESFAQDQDLFFTTYARAHVKTSELGQEDKLLCEFQDSQNNMDGGYLESSRLRKLVSLFNSFDESPQIISIDDNEPMKQRLELADKKANDDAAHGHHH